MEKFSSRYGDLGRKSRVLDNRGIWPSFSYEHIEIFYEEKSRESRSRKLSQTGWPGLYEEALSEFGSPKEVSVFWSRTCEFRARN